MIAVTKSKSHKNNIKKVIFGIGVRQHDLLPHYCCMIVCLLTFTACLFPPSACGYVVLLFKRIGDVTVLHFFFGNIIASRYIIGGNEAVEDVSKQGQN